jgi:hypothetical protein
MVAQSHASKLVFNRQRWSLDYLERKGDMKLKEWIIFLLYEKEYVKTNGYYGYGCACMDVVTDSNRLRISEIRGGESLPLSTCREDPNVPKSP